MLRSLVRPDRISSPMTRTAAVTVVGPLMSKTPSNRGARARLTARPGGKRRQRLVLSAARSICVASETTSGKGTLVTTSTIFVPAADQAARRSGQIRLHGPEDFAGMRMAGALTAEALDLIGPLVKPGVTTASLDRLVFEFARDHDAYPAPLNYRGYRKSMCTSINHVVCHGIPDDKSLRDGDILNIDVTLIVDGWHGDASRMFVAGEAPRRAQRLIDVTYEAMM